MGLLARFVLLMLVWMPHARAQPMTAGERGRPVFAHRYSADTYGLHNQNWSVAQDARGVVYVANTYGVLEYDAERWRTISVPNELVRSLASDEDGTIFVGGTGEFGYLAPDSIGTMRYVSLLSEVPVAARDFADVWTVLATSDGVYFQTFDRIYRWDGVRMHAWTTDDRFHKAFVVADTYYVREEGVGLLRIENGDLIPVPGGHRFANERIDVMLPHAPGGVLIRTRTQGFVVSDGNQIRPYRTGADAYLSDKRVYHGTVLYDGTYALTTFSGSVVLMSRDGQVLRILAADVGLEPGDLVLYAMPDAQHGLWLALGDGILRVDVPAALTVFGSESGLEGTVYTIRRHQGALYVGTTQGLYKLEPGQRLSTTASSVFDPPRFVPIAGIDDQCYDLAVAGAVLLAATNDGVYEIRDHAVRRILSDKAFALGQDDEQGRVYVGLKEGVAVLEQGRSGWQETSRLDGIDEEIRSLARGPDGALWLGTLSSGVARVEMGSEGATSFAWYGEPEGLPGGPALVWSSGEHLTFHTLSGLYRLDEVNEAVRFTPHAALNAVIEPDGATHYMVSEQAGGTYWLWVDEDGRLEKYRRDERGDLVNETPPVLNRPGLQVRSVFEETDGMVWVASDEGLFRYEASLEKTYAEPYPALVRGVYDKEGTVIYGGAGGFEGLVPEIPHELNNLRFTYAAPSYNAPEATVYQYWLEGFDEEWSDWSEVPLKEYTNLPEDAYRFHVRARNAQGIVSEEGVFGLRVLPPWWRTWWAYSAYVLAAGLIVWGYGRMQLRRHAAELEREREVNRQLETANARLHEANDRLQQADKLKDDFLANTSHELRTPLTSILGFASVLQEDLGGELRTYAEMIQQGGERLLNTVNSLLEMARLQADLMELDPVTFEVVAEVENVIDQLEPEASAKGIYIAVAPKRREIEVRLDRFCLQRIISNVVENAVKFTDEGGVTVVLDATNDEVAITIRDTGIGIGEEFLPELFSEFHQVSTGYGRAYEGNGLGLAITQRLVSLLEGTIEVESELEQGTEVRIRLPRFDQRGVGGALPSEVSSHAERALSVLLVDSPERAHPRLRHLLTTRCSMTHVTGGSEGLAEAQRTPYDLVLIDSQLPPDERGETVLEQLRALPGYAAVPAVAIAAYSRPGDSELYQRLGFSAHIGKPITQHRVQRILDLARVESARTEVASGPRLAELVGRD